MERTVEEVWLKIGEAVFRRGVERIGRARLAVK
jgi:hypothetical protein